MCKCASVKQIEANAKLHTRFYYLAVQGRSADDEGPRPVGKTTGPGARGCWREDTRVIFRARDLAKDAPKRAPQNIPAEAGGKVNGIPRGQVEPAS